MVKRSIINLGRAHVPALRAAHSRPDARFHFGLRLADGGFKFGRELQLVFNEIVKPIADLPQFCRRELP